MCYSQAMVSKLWIWIASHPRWSAAVVVLIAAPAIAYGALAWKTSLRSDRLASVDRLVEQFDQVAFRSEREGDTKQRIQKWTKRVHIGIEGGDTDKWRPVIERHMAAIANLAGIDLFPMFLLPVSDENFFIYFVERSKFEALVIQHFFHPGKYLENLEDYNCFAAPSLWGHSIDKVVVIISSDLDDNFISLCVFKVLTHMLGLPNNSELIRPSVFSRWDFYFRRLSINDRIIVRTLYDKRVRVGMHRDEALEVARLIITELVAEAKANEAARGD